MTAEDEHKQDVIKFVLKMPIINVAWVSEYNKKLMKYLQLNEITLIKHPESLHNNNNKLGKHSPQ